MSDTVPHSPSRRAYRCACGASVFFRNSACLSCHRQLGYEPQRAQVVALHATERDDQWTIHSEGGASGTGRRYHRCANYARAAACNWLRPVNITLPGGDDGLCIACSLNRTIPDQSLPENQALWHSIEVAKRRLVSQLLGLQLPVNSLARTPWQDPQRGMAFDFLLDQQGQPPILTGHAHGVITLNAQEADDAIRERNRTALHEPYRTLLGHLRHEVAHYYWDRLVAGTEWLAPFRQLFGDERQDYAQALQRHYTLGAPFDWATRHVSAYASSHPWEDWAETWAHYLHIRDGMDTARSFGLQAHDIESGRPPYTLGALWDSQRPDAQAFLNFLNDWLNITAVLNELSGSMGERDFYPFVLPAAAVAKLQLVHAVVSAAQASAA
ncbi:MAG: putative zinc-binding metallopeptidase [Burkholderiaceae bacterium]